MKTECLNSIPDAFPDAIFSPLYYIWAIMAISLVVGFVKSLRYYRLRKNGSTDSVLTSLIGAYMLIAVLAANTYLYFMQLEYRIEQFEQFQIPKKKGMT